MKPPLKSKTSTSEEDNPRYHYEIFDISLKEFERLKSSRSLLLQTRSHSVAPLLLSEATEESKNIALLERMRRTQRLGRFLMSPQWPDLFWAKL